MKKILVMLLLVCAVASISACGMNNTKNDTTEKVPNNNVDNTIDMVPENNAPTDTTPNGTNNTDTTPNDNTTPAGDAAKDIKNGIKDTADEVKNDLQQNTR